jgi:type VI secretion system secreted protein VgrG
MTRAVLTDPFTLECSALSGRIRVSAFRGDEELGRCFDYQVYFLLEGDDFLGVSPADVVGTSAVLVLGDHAEAVRIHGKVAELELLEAVEHATYRLRLVPDLWFLRHSAHSRVFVDRTVVEIVEDVLKKAGITSSGYELRLRESYAKREHVCQYHESDLAFVERWLEREGIYYFFDHQDDGKLVLVDAASAHASLRSQPVPYHPRGGEDESAGEMLRSFRRVSGTRPKEAETTDYNYMTPDVAIAETAAIGDELESRVVQWLENEPDGAGAKRASTLRSERETARARRHVAQGRAIGVHAGFTFAVDRHPVGELNRDYLAVRVCQRGQILEHRDRGFPFFDRADREALGAEVLQIEVDAVASDVQFRTPRRTPWPRASGLELGHVDGPDASEYAQLDDQGRYLVRLMLDEEETADGKASTRIRQLQPHAGAVEGCHFPLRKGTEVLVAFLAGDPDRPVIAGAMPHALDPSVVTRDNQTQNVLQTGGRNRFELEDDDGRQYVDISSPPQNTFFHFGAHAGLGDHNIVMSTDGDGLVHTGGNRDITIDGDQNEDVQGDLTETYESDQTTHVAGAFTETIDAGSTQTIHAGLVQTISGGLNQTISGSEARTVDGGVTETINGSRTQTIGASSVESVVGTQTQTVDGSASITTPASYTVTAAGGITLKTDGMMNVMTSTYLMSAPGGQTNLDSYFCKIAGLEVNIYALRVAVNLLVATQMHFAIAATGYRNDRFIGKLELNGIAVKNDGTKKQSSETQDELMLAFLGFGFLLLL